MNIKTLGVILLLLTAVSGNALAQESKEAGGQIVVNVLGEVNNPARYVLPAGATVLDLLASAGDSKASADLSKSLVIHVPDSNRVNAIAVDLKKTLAAQIIALVLVDKDTLVIPMRSQPLTMN